jgi:hypothetical protein
MAQGREIQYWLACPVCGCQMEVSDGVGPDRRGKHCDKCHSNFSYTKEKLAIAESLGFDQRPRLSEVLPQLGGKTNAKKPAALTERDVKSGFESPVKQTV